MSRAKFQSTLLVDVNGDRLEGKADGRMNIATGEVLVTHRYDRSPRNFDFSYLTVGALTGVPVPARPIGVVTNPFTDSGSFEFDRSVTFLGAGCQLRVQGGYERTGNHERKGFLGVIGEAPVGPARVSVEPTVETWIPEGDGKTIRGVFQMSWPGVDGQRVQALAETRYELTDSPAMQRFDRPHFRYITIQYQADGSIFLQEEQISLFAGLKEHTAHIETIPRVIPTEAPEELVAV
ncbi:MAG: hypothetical protein MI919_11610 [Holophagales bacterium]|nr:hypothetical protein [Holophagales bacterium]